jgi:dolichol-phosphate mannosyltransferase
MKIYVLILTYNERENIALLIEEIKKLGLENLKIVVVDDSSSDGTIEIVREMIEKLGEIELLVRKTNKGRAYAEVEGLKYCLKKGAECVIQMDADFSHKPCYIPMFIEEIKTADLVIGSRFVKGGKLVRSGIMRNFITGCARYYMNLVLGMQVKDPTSGYRCYKSNVLNRINLEATVSDGFALLQELLYKTHRHGFSIKEIPIVFEDRIRGSSKFHHFSSILQGLVYMLIFRILFHKTRDEEVTEVY